jgi:hypothetical protein
MTAYLCRPARQMRRYSGRSVAKRATVWLAAIVSGSFRTRAQLMSHAKGGCNGKASPSRSDGESNDSAPASIRQRRVSELVSVSVMRPERNRRHTIEIQNADSVVVEPKPVSDGKLTADERPEVKLDVKPDVNVLNGMQLKSCVIEISPLKKPVDETTPAEDDCERQGSSGSRRVRRERDGARCARTRSPLQYTRSL